MVSPLAALSDSIARIVASTAPLLTAIRVGYNRHITGLLIQRDAVVTTDQALPALDKFTVVLSTQAVQPARLASRDPGSNLAVLRLQSPLTIGLPEIGTATLGGIAIVAGADADGSPTVRLTMIRRFVRTALGAVPMLDLAPGSFDEGGAVLDAHGRLLGLGAIGAAGEPMVIPAETILRMIQPEAASAAPTAPFAQPVGRRGWLGVSLQPITVPDHLIQRVGQSSGRMVVSLTSGGPAEQAGLCVGDVVLALNDSSASGPHALRAFLAAERIGTTIEVKLMRDGNLFTTQLVVAAQP